MAGPRFVVRAWLRRTTVLNGEVFWKTIYKSGRYKVQHNEDPTITSYDYRIIYCGDSLTTIHAHAWSLDGIKAALKELIGESF